MVRPGWSNNVDEFFEYEASIGLFVVIIIVAIFLICCTVFFFIGLANGYYDDDDTNTVTCPAYTFSNDDGECDAVTGVCTCNTCPACTVDDGECDAATGVCTCKDYPPASDDGKCDANGVCTCPAYTFSNDDGECDAATGVCTCKDCPPVSGATCDAATGVCTCKTCPTVSGATCDANGVCTCKNCPPVSGATCSIGLDFNDDPDLVLWFPMDTACSIYQKGSDPDTYGRELSISKNAAYDDESHEAWKFDGTSYLYDLGDDSTSDINAYKTVCEGMRKAYTINIWASLDISLIKIGETMGFFALGSHSAGLTKNSIGLYRKDNNTLGIQNGWYGCGYYSTISLFSGDKSFHMYTCVYDDNDDIRSIYFDGELVSSAVTECVPDFKVLTAGTTEVDVLRNGLTIGTSGDSSYLTGELFDLRLYSKALNGAAVNDIYSTMMSKLN